MTTMGAPVAPAPVELEPTWRYAGDDWAGANALTYVVWQVEPIYAADGTLVTAGVPVDLTGYGVSGALRYRLRQVFVSSGGVPPVPPSIGLPPPTGSIIGPGKIALSLSRTSTGFPRQAISLWGQLDASLLIAQPMVTDPSGNLVTVGLQPVFVF